MPHAFLEAALGAAVALATVTVGLGQWYPRREQIANGMAAAETVVIAPGAIELPTPGEFLIDGRPAPAPVVSERFANRLYVMKHQVSLAEYGHCVAAGACKEADAAMSEDASTIPVTGINYLDAQAYAGWYARISGKPWRLPTAAEWAFLAGERFTEGRFSAAADDPANPAVGWIRRYFEDAALKRVPDPGVKRRGHYGANSKGVEDIAGNVWEWTSTCYRRTSLAADGRTVTGETENCGVHVLGGRHRAYNSNFIRDGKSGGCAVGMPPEHLGLRLVLEQRGTPLVSWLRTVFRRADAG